MSLRTFAASAYQCFRQACCGRLSAPAFGAELAAAAPPVGMGWALASVSQASAIPLAASILLGVLSTLAFCIGALIGCQAVVRRLRDAGRSFRGRGLLVLVSAAFLGLHGSAAYLNGVPAAMAHGLAWTVSGVACVAYLGWVAWLPPTSEPTYLDEPRETYAPDAVFFL